MGRGNLEEWFGSLDAGYWMLVAASARIFNIPISEYPNI
jgi:hypothetical protein